MVQAASIHLRRGKVYVDTESLTTSGFWIGVGPVKVVDQNDTAAIADALRAALRGSTSGVPTPGADDDLTGPILGAAGVKTWRAFVRDAQCISAKLNDGVVTLTPYRRVDKAGNYVPVPEKEIAVRLASKDLGDAVIGAFGNAD